MPTGLTQQQFIDEKRPIRRVLAVLDGELKQFSLYIRFQGERAYCRMLKRRKEAAKTWGDFTIPQRLVASRYDGAIHVLPQGHPLLARLDLTGDVPLSAAKPKGQ